MTPSSHSHLLVEAGLLALVQLFVLSFSLLYHHLLLVPPPPLRLKRSMQQLQRKHTRWLMFKQANTNSGHLDPAILLVVIRNYFSTCVFYSDSPSFTHTIQQTHNYATYFPVLLSCYPHNLRAMKLPLTVLLYCA